MPFHDVTELPAGFCNSETTLESQLSTSDRVQLIELLHLPTYMKIVEITRH